MPTQILDPRQGIQLSGGRSEGGVVRGTPLTMPGYDDTIPEFLRQAAEPYIQQKQQEQFFKGYMEQAAAGAEVDLLDNPKNPLSRIWPTGYEQGAAFSQSMTKVNETVAAWLADDELKKMKPEEAAKKLADDSKNLMTGNPLVDGLMQKALVEKMGPVADAVQKRRIAWQIDNASVAYTKYQGSQGDLFQKTAMALSLIHI